MLIIYLQATLVPSWLWPMAMPMHHKKGKKYELETHISSITYLHSIVI